MKHLTLNETAAWLQGRDCFVVLTHRRPDGDTIGCAAALCRGLRQLGKTAHILRNPQFTEKYRPFLEGLTCGEIPEGSHVVAVDIAADHLLPYDLPECTVELVIDHHGRNTEYALAGHVVPEAAACGEVIGELLQELGVVVDKAMAEALYVAISTDTGCFRYSNTTADTLRSAAFCKDCGADTYTINHIFFQTKRLPRLQLEARLTEHTEFHAGGMVAISAIYDSWREELGLTEDDIDDISGFGREIAGVKIAAMIRQTPDGGKISLRTSPDYDASAICATLGGGGHKAAAGATVPGGIEEAKAAILKAILGVIQ